MKETQYIVVEGPIGVGKTTLARLLADEFTARTVLERVDENPFLSRFYEDPEKYAFPAQLFSSSPATVSSKELHNKSFFGKICSQTTCLPRTCCLPRSI